MIGLALGLTAAKPLTLGSVIALKAEKNVYVVSRVTIYPSHLETQKLGTIRNDGSVYEGWYHAPYLVLREEGAVEAGSSVTVVRIMRDRCRSAYQETFPSTWDLKMKAPNQLDLYVLHTDKPRTTKVDGLTIRELDYETVFDGQRHNKAELADGDWCKKTLARFPPKWPRPGSSASVPVLDSDRTFEISKYEEANRWPGIVGFCGSTHEMAVRHWSGHLDDSAYLAVIQPRRKPPVRVIPTPKTEGGSLAMGSGFLASTGSGTVTVRRLSDLRVAGSFSCDYAFAEQR